MKYQLLSTALTILLATGLTTAQKPIDTIQKGKTAAWMDEAKFGLFIHWGIYSQLARGEWVMSKEKIQIEDYKKNAETFNPVKFNAEEWVSIAKNAGMKYITITSKHHDGFCLFDTNVDDYNAVDGTPFGRDIIKELKEECDKQGIRFGVYYSQAQDWYHPGGQSGKRMFDPAQEGDFKEYLNKVSIPQIKELITHYGVEHLWFDTPINMKVEDGYAIAKAVDELDASTLMNSRLLYHGGEAADLTREQLDELEDVGVDFLSYKDRTIPENSPWEYWETCMTLSNAWGYREGDDAWKDKKTVVKMLTEVVSKGGTLLLNVGPTGEGVIPQAGVDVLAEVGDWLKVNGESIYGATKAPYEGYGEYLETTKKVLAKLAKEEQIAKESGADLGESKKVLAGIEKKRKHVARLDYHWLTTGKEGKVYVHLYKWPSSPFTIKDFQGEVSKAYFLADKETPLAYKLENGTLTLELPENPVDETATVVCLEVK